MWSALMLSSFPSWSRVRFYLLDIFIPNIWYSDRKLQSEVIRNQNTTLEQTAGTESRIFPLSCCCEVTCDKTWCWWGWPVCLHGCVWYLMKQKKMLWPTWMLPAHWCQMSESRRPLPGNHDLSMCSNLTNYCRGLCLLLCFQSQYVIHEAIYQ